MEIYLYSVHASGGMRTSRRCHRRAGKGEAEWVEECLSAARSAVDVNYIRTVSLRVKCTETVLREEGPDEVKIEYQEFKTDVTVLFAAAHSDHTDVVRKLVRIPGQGLQNNHQLLRAIRSNTTIDPSEPFPVTHERGN